MNTTLLIILGEAFIILTVLAVGAAILNWRRVKNRQAALEDLLDQVSETETVRKEKLINYLVDNHQLDNNKSAELCEDFIEAEKRFMYEFIQQQLGQVPVSGFYENVCRLLDNYLQLLTTTSSETSREQQKPVPAQEDESSTEANNEDSGPQPKEEETDTVSQESAEQIEGDANREDPVSPDQEMQDEFVEDSAEKQDTSDSTIVPAIDKTAEEEPDEFAVNDEAELEKKPDE